MSRKTNQKFRRNEDKPSQQPYQANLKESLKIDSSYSVRLIKWIEKSLDWKSSFQSNRIEAKRIARRNARIKVYFLALFLVVVVLVVVKPVVIFFMNWTT